MKTKLFLIATLFISTITFSQNKKSERKGYTYYKNTSDLSKSKRMNKGELIDAMAKDAGLSKADAGKALNASISKRAARTGRNPQTGTTIINNGTIEVEGDFEHVVQQKSGRTKLLDSNLLKRNKSYRNPQIKRVNKPKKVAKFKAGKALADIVH